MAPSKTSAQPPTDERRLLRAEDGAAASEYAVLLGLLIVAVAIAVAIFDLAPAFQAVVGIVLNCVNGGC